MSDIRSRFVRFLSARELVRRGDRVLVALSGGVDSVVLLHLFRAAAPRLKIEVRAAHFDHALRAESGEDAAWVSGLCDAWQVPLISTRTDRPLYGEADARSERYRFLLETARATRSTRLATAHHADDQVETVLFRILRGAGLRGLSGIPVRRGRIIRPLLRFSKAELLEYADRHQLVYRRDATNDEPGFARNRIRKTVIPALETVRPEARSAVLALARYAARTEAAWRSALARIEGDVVIREAANLIELARPLLLEYHPELRARLLRQMLRRHGVVAGRAQTGQVVKFCERAASGARLPVGGDVHVERAFDTIRLVRSRDPDAAQGASLTLAGTTGSGRLELAGRRYVVAWGLADVREAEGEFFDPALSRGSLELRAWRPGDRIRLAFGTKKLKKLFAEKRIPAGERRRLAVLVDERGHVLWVVGVVRSVDAQAGETGEALKITVEDAELS